MCFAQAEYSDVRVLQMEKLFRLKQNGKYVNPAKVVAPRGGSIPRNRMNDFKNRKALIGEYLSGKRSLSDYKR